jgi:plastocyanin
MSQLSFRRLTPVALLSVLLISCGGGGGGGGDGGTPPSTTAITKSGGDAQNGTVGQPLANPLAVTVTEGGAASAGATVTWSTLATNSSVNPASVVTDANGVASTMWTLGTVSGSQTANATLSGASGSPVSFTATAAADAATTLSKASGDNQNGDVSTALSAPVQAKVSDQFQNGVSGTTVTWAASGATISATSVPTDASGISSVNVILGATAGPVTITATAGSLAGSPLTFNATASAPAPVGATVQVLTTGGNRFDPSSVTIPAHTKVVWNWPSGSLGHNVVPDGGTMPASSGGLANGPHQYSFTFDVPGTYRYFCQAHGGPGGIGMSGTVTVQ